MIEELEKLDKNFSEGTFLTKVDPINEDILACGGTDLDEYIYHDIKWYHG